MMVLRAALPVGVLVLVLGGFLGAIQGSVLLTTDGPPGIDESFEVRVKMRDQSAGQFSVLPNRAELCGV